MICYFLFFLNFILTIYIFLENYLYHVFKCINNVIHDDSLQYNNLYCISSLALSFLIIFVMPFLFLLSINLDSDLFSLLSFPKNYFGFCWYSRLCHIFLLTVSFFYFTTLCSYLYFFFSSTFFNFSLLLFALST